MTFSQNTADWPCYFIKWSRGGGRGGSCPPDFRNLCSKSPNHVVYSPTIAPPAPQSWRPPWFLAIILVLLSPTDTLGLIGRSVTPQTRTAGRSRKTPDTWLGTDWKGRTKADTLALLKTMPEGSRLLLTWTSSSGTYTNTYFCKELLSLFFLKLVKKVFGLLQFC